MKYYTATMNISLRRAAAAVCGAGLLALLPVRAPRRGAPRPPARPSSVRSP